MPKNIRDINVDNKIIERISKFCTPHRARAIYALITDDDEPGEYIELNRLLRNTRLMPGIARKRNFDLVQAFDKFSSEQDATAKSKWRLWNIRPKGGKSDPADLRLDLAQFNNDINRHFTAIREKLEGRFEILLLCIHLDYSDTYKKFDIHAHLICKIEPEDYDDTYKKIHLKFSEEDMPDEAIKNPSASANYVVSGTIKHEKMIEWPHAAFEAACDLFIPKASENKAPRLIRACGSFRAWRSKQGDRQPLDPAGKAERARRAENRRQTADPRGLEPLGYRVIKRVENMWVGESGRNRNGWLVRQGPSPTLAPTKLAPPIRAPKSPANITAIQRVDFDIAKPFSCYAIARSWWWHTWDYGHSFRTLPRPIRRRLARTRAASGHRKILVRDAGELTSRFHYGRYVGRSARTQVPAVSPPSTS